MPRLGPFTLLSPLAQGGMSRIWRGQHPSGVQVAIKVVTVGTGSREQRALAREIRAAAALSHPNIVELLDAGQVPQGVPELPEGAPYLAMELADAGSLKQRVGRTPWLQILVMLRELLGALAHAHARGVVHRDLKPGNVLIGPQGQALLADFGLAHALGAGRGERLVVGTPTYMAPEQLLGSWREFGPWTDLYALGVMAWELCATRPPFVSPHPESLRQAHLSQDPPNFRPILNVPNDLESWLRRLLQKSPFERFHSAADALQALNALGAAEQPRAVSVEQRTWAPGMSEGHFVRAMVASPARTPPRLPTHQRPGRSLMEGVGLGLFSQRRVPLSGRDAQMQLLWDGLRRVHLSGTLHGVVLRGPAGVGKSHLAGWLCERAVETGAATVLRATHSPRGAASEGMAGALAWYFDAVGLEDPQEHLQRRLAAMGGSGLEAQSLSQWILNEPTEELSPGAKAGLLARLIATQDRPMVLLLDDAQWSTEALPLAQALSARREDLPLLILVTLREEALEPIHQSRVDDLLHHKLWREQTLRPLAPQDTRALVQSLLRVDPELAAKLQERSAGNPLMAVQLLGQLVEQGTLLPGKQGFYLPEKSTVGLPNTLSGVWLGRLPSFAPRQMQALELAAALGTEVNGSEWTALCALLPDLEQLNLEEVRDALLDRGLAEPRPQGWAFVHGLLQETLLDQARREGRLELHHQSCARILSDPRHAMRKAQHLLAAGELEQGARALCLAGHIARVGAPPARIEEIAQRLDETLQALGDRPGLQWERAQALILRGSLYWTQGRFEEAFALDNEALTIARDLNDPLLISYALTRKAESTRQRGHLEGARTMFTSALAWGEKTGVSAALLDARCGLADVARQQRQWEEAIGHLEAAATLWQRPQEVDQRAVRKRASLLRSLAAVYKAKGDYETSQRVLDRALEQAQQGRYSIMLANLYNDIADLARLRGAFEQARTGYQRAADMLDSVGSYGGVYPRLNLGLLGVATEDVELAQRSCEAALQECARYGLSQLEPGIYVCMAWCAAKLQEWPAMEEHLALAELGFSMQQDLDLDNAWPAVRAGALAHRAGRPELAQGAWQIALEQYRGLGQRAEQARVQQLLEQL